MSLLSIIVTSLSIATEIDDVVIAIKNKIFGTDSILFDTIIYITVGISLNTKILSKIRIFRANSFSCFIPCNDYRKFDLERII
jgi:uncharacterized membrane protein YuzA (DUF378 family)